jgi:hypothetical protein
MSLTSETREQPVATNVNQPNVSRARATSGFGHLKFDFLNHMKSIVNRPIFKVC